MELRILGFESRNLRCLDTKIRLTDENNEPYKVSLIQIPNGHGKSTISSLIRCAFDGSANDPDFDMFEYQSESNDEKGEFTLDLTVNSEAISFKMEFDFALGEVTYFTNTPDLGGFKKGRITVDNYKGLKMFQKPQWSELFIFDGELCHKLLERNNSSAKKAIETLCQVYLFDEAIEFLKNKKERHLNQQSTTKKSQVKTSRGMTGLETRLENIKKQITRVSLLKKDLETKLEETNEKIKKLENILTINAEDEKNQAKKVELTKIKDQLNSDLNEEILYAKEYLLQPYNLFENFKNEISEFDKSLEDHGLPGDASEKWFTDLSKKEVCVCGRAIDEDCKKFILSNFHSHLSNETAGLIGAIRKDIGAIDQNTKLNTADIISKLNTKYKLAEDATTNLALHTKGQINSDKNEKTKELKEYQKLIENKTTYELQLKNINRPMDQDKDKDHTSTCLDFLHKELNKLQRSKSEAAGTLDLYEKLDLVENILLESKKITSNNLIKEIKDQCNERLKNVLSGQPILIESIDQNIKILRKKRVSVGQTLSTAYVFLTSLLDRGNNSFPLVMDSPAGPIDDDVRKEIAELIPSLTDQFISFVISVERSSFADVLADNSNGNIQFITGFNYNNKKISETNEIKFEKYGNGAFNFQKNFFFEFLTGDQETIQKRVIDFDESEN